MMRRNPEEQITQHRGSKATVEGDMRKSLFASNPKSPTQNGRPSSMVFKKAHTVIPAHIIAEAISTLHGLDLRWSGPITPTEMQYVEQYVLAKYPEYSNALVEGGEKTDLYNLCIKEEPSNLLIDDKRKSPRCSLREPSPPSFGSNLPDLDKTQLEPSRLLDTLTKKSSFLGSFISIPEIQARNKVLKHCGLPDEEYLVLFTPNYKDAMMLVGESYPFFRGNFYMTVIREEGDYIREFATYKESKVVVAPETWLDPVDVNGTRYSMHWVSEAHRNAWHVLLDTTALMVGEDQLNLALHRPDFVLCSPDNTHAHPSKITCLLFARPRVATYIAQNEIHCFR